MGDFCKEESFFKCMLSCIFFIRIYMYTCIKPSLEMITHVKASKDCGRKWWYLQCNHSWGEIYHTVSFIQLYEENSLEGFIEYRLEGTNPLWIYSVICRTFNVFLILKWIKLSPIVHPMETNFFRCSRRKIRNYMNR